MSQDDDTGLLHQGIYWGRANLWMLATLALLVSSSFLPSSDTTIEETVLAPLADLIVPGALILFWFTSRAYNSAAAIFTPANVVQAKQANEQIKLMATFFNNLAVAGVIGILLTKTLPGSGLPFLELIYGIAAAINAHLTGRDLLYFLKDERDVAYRAPDTDETVGRSESAPPAPASSTPK